MKSKASVAAELSWAQVHAFRLERHHLLARAPKKDLVKVAGEVGGLQAQVMAAAELQLGVRVDCRVDDVRAALWKDKKLVKTWLMRGTLHLVPAADLPIYTAAMSTRWIRNTNAWLKYLDLSESEFASLVRAIGDAMGANPMTRDEIVQAVGQGRSDKVRDIMRSGWGGVLKPVARRGLLCFGPSRGQTVTFVRPDQWLDAWREVDPDKALVEVVRRYLRAYGPATKHDFARWWGSWSGVGNAAWSGLANELVPVAVEGDRADLLAADLDRISRASGGQSVTLLPGFDPYLMGHASRGHLVDATHLSKVSRTAGWISPVVLVGGRVAATWSYTVLKQTLRVSVEPFRRLPPGTMPLVRARVDSMARTLGLDATDVKVVS
jgi:winged helix DNA-binding protein